jgi:hypothetical protein
MTEAPNTIELKIGLTCKTARVCAEGRARIKAVNGVLGYKSSDRVEETTLTTEHIVARKPYVFCRFTSPTTGKMTRPELGRFLLNAERSVRHINGDPLDFRIENLEPIPERECRPVVKESADCTARPLNATDGKNAEEQIEILASIYADLLKEARKTLHDPPPSAKGRFVTEGRAGEIVANLMPGLIERIRAGKIRDIIKVAYTAVKVQAAKEKWRKDHKFGPIQEDPGQKHFMKHLRKQMPGEDKSFFLASSDGGRTTDLHYNPSASKSPQTYYEDFLVSASDE